MYDISLNDEKITFKGLEQKICKYACDLACSIISEVLENLDKRLMTERNTKSLRDKGKRHTCIKTIMGDVEINRRIYEYNIDGGKKAYKYLLNEFLGMDTIGHMSMNLVENILNNVTEVSYRKTANNIKLMCNQDVSHTAVWNVVQNFGERLKKRDERKIELNKQGKLNGKDEKRMQKLNDLYNYLLNNKEGLIPYHLRKDIDLPEPHEGLVYRHLGTMEHNICDILAQRMKGRKMSWFIGGAESMAKIQAEKFSGRLYKSL